MPKPSESLLNDFVLHSCLNTEKCLKSSFLIFTSVEKSFNVHSQLFPVVRILFSSNFCILICTRKWVVLLSQSCLGFLCYFCFFKSYSNSPLSSFCRLPVFYLESFFCISVLLFHPVTFVSLKFASEFSSEPAKLFPICRVSLLHAYVFLFPP